MALEDNLSRSCGAPKQRQRKKNYNVSFRVYDNIFVWKNRKSLMTVVSCDIFLPGIQLCVKLCVP